MNKDIFHECICTGQKMTYQEWGEYVQNHQVANEVAHRCGEFEYNIFDICLNPHLALELKTGLNTWCTIRTCQIDSGKWGYGVNYSLGTLVGCHGAGYHGATFDTERAAVYAGLQEVEKSCSKAIDRITIHGEHPDDEEEQSSRGSSYLPRLKSLRKKIEACKQRYNPMIRSLFD